MSLLRRGLPGDHRRDSSWREAELVSVDFEATSAEPREAQPLSVGWVVVREGRVRCGDAGYAVLRHHDAAPSDSLRIHGLTPADLAEGIDPAEVGDHLAAVLEGRILLAHGARLDRALAERLGATTTVAIDTLAMVRRLDERAGRRGADPRLPPAAERYHVPAPAAHLALADAFACALLLVTVAGRIEAERGRCTLDDLLRLGKS